MCYFKITVNHEVRCFYTYMKGFCEPLWALSYLWSFVFCWSLVNLNFLLLSFFPSLCVSSCVFFCTVHLCLGLSGSSNWKQKFIPNITVMKKNTWTLYLSGYLGCFNDLCNTLTIHSTFTVISLQTLDIFFISKHFLKVDLKDISLSFINVSFIEILSVS